MRLMQPLSAQRDRGADGCPCLAMTRHRSAAFARLSGWLSIREAGAMGGPTLRRQRHERELRWD